MPTRRYAEGTEVPIAKSKYQLEALLIAHGAEQYHTGWTTEQDIIEFGFRKVQIRFTLKRLKVGAFNGSRSPQKAMEQADRQRWRALYLVVRAKLESVEAGIGVFEQEFMGFIVTPSNETIGEILLPRIAAGESLRLLGAGDGR